VEHHVDDYAEYTERWRRGDEPEQIARQEQRFANERSELLAERTALAPVDPSVVPFWSSRVEIRSGTSEFESSAESAFGWPCRALAFGEVIDLRIDDVRNPVNALGGSDWLDALCVQTDHQQKALPLRPIWKGFVINAVLFSIPLVILAWLRGRAARKGK
jgi:hypothetical protein